MTTINAVITTDGIFCTGDTLVTTVVDQQVKERFSFSKKIIEAHCTLHSQYPELKNIYNGENSKTYNIGFGFAGNVSLIDSLKSRLNHKFSYGSYGKVSTIKEVSLLNICLFYVDIFNNILENHLFTYYENQLRIGLNDYDYNSINTSSLLFGYCEVEKKHKIYKIYIDNNFRFKQIEFSDLYSVVTIGDQTKEVNRILNEYINKEKSKDLDYLSLLTLFNSLIFKFIIDINYKTIGGFITSYHLFKNNIHEIIIEDPFFGTFLLSGLTITERSSELYISSLYLLTLNTNLIGKSDIKNYYALKNKEIFEIVKFLEINNLKIKLDGAVYKAYFYQDGDFIEFLDFPYDDIYYSRIIQDIINRTKFLVKYYKNEYIHLNYQCLGLQAILYDL